MGYIEREEALEALSDSFTMSMALSVDECRGMRLARKIDCEVIARIPAADVVARDCYDRLLAENDELRKERPVVRCKDCKYSAVDFEDMRYCKLVTYYNHVPDDWYCADGERKGGDGDV